MALPLASPHSLMLNYTVLKNTIEILTKIGAAEYCYRFPGTENWFKCKRYPFRAATRVDRLYNKIHKIIYFLILHEKNDMKKYYSSSCVCA